jgi:hypothetical protein
MLWRRLPGLLAWLVCGGLVCGGWLVWSYVIDDAVRRALDDAVRNSRAHPYKYVWSKGFGLAADSGACSLYVLLGLWPSDLNPCRVSLHPLQIKHRDLVWVKSKHLAAFADDILPNIHPGVRFALVTGDADWAVPAVVPCINCPHSSSSQLNLTEWNRATQSVLQSESVARWFTQNLCLAYDASRMECLSRNALRKEVRDQTAKVLALPIGFDLHTKGTRGEGAGGRIATVREQEQIIEDVQTGLPPNRERPLSIHVAFTTNSASERNGVPGYHYRATWLRHLDTEEHRQSGFVRKPTKWLARDELWKVSQLLCTAFSTFSIRALSAYARKTDTSLTDNSL